MMITDRKKERKKKKTKKKTASVLKQDPNTKRFKRTRIYFNMDTQCHEDLVDVVIVLTAISN